jgi:hypothetical protein
MLYRFTRRHDIVHVPVPTVRYLVNPSSFYTQWDKDKPAAQPAGEGT